MVKPDYPKSPVVGLARNASGDLNISEEAKEKLVGLATDKLDKVSSMALEFARHAGRKTVRKEDVKLALEKL